MMDIQHADHLSSAHQRNRDQRLIGVFDQGRKVFEAGVREGAIGKRYCRLVLGHPSRDAFAYIKANLPDFSVMGQLRCAEHNVSRLVIRQIDQASVAGRLPRP